MCVYVCVCECVWSPDSEISPVPHGWCGWEEASKKDIFLRKDRERKEVTVICRTEQVIEISKTNLEFSGWAFCIATCSQYSLLNYMVIYGRYFESTWEKVFFIHSWHLSIPNLKFGEKKELKQREKRGDLISDECEARSQSFPQRHPPSPPS